MTSYERVLDHLQKHGSITSVEAIHLYGNTRLSDSVYKLKKKGYSIVSVDENGVNRYGEKTRYARYYLKGDYGC